MGGKLQQETNGASNSPTMMYFSMPLVLHTCREVQKCGMADGGWNGV